ncbi:hypothetical protein P4J10_23110 [Bacillus cereus]|uniref:hypothetical protein n=1 Tax=Bacillus thuringiensis TaxID=1428 RepID=UPI00111CFFD9|nr:hypothetical protein [Bacillus thuringiensis]MEB9469485.1 hypothetical protein [Bacillus cereus]
MTNTTKTKKKNFYKEGEIVQLKATKELVKVTAIDTKTHDATIAFKNGKTLTVKLWDIRKKPVRKAAKVDEIFFAKVREGAVIPTKRDEDAAYDFWASLEPETVEEDGVERKIHELFLPKGQVTVVPTGVASAMLKKFALNFTNEKSSIGSLGMITLGALVDSGYRNEIGLLIMPLVYDVLISSEVNEVEIVDGLEEGTKMITVPYNKAIAQAWVLPVPRTKSTELTYEELLKISSERQLGGFGSTDNKEMKR